MIVTVAPFPRVFNTSPPGFSRMNAPPPSAARMMAMMGVGSDVTVAVEVFVGASVTSDVLVAGLGVCEDFAVGGLAVSVAFAVGASVAVAGAFGVGMATVTVGGTG